MTSYPTLNRLVESRSTTLTSEQAIQWLQTNAPRQLAQLRTLDDAWEHEGIWRGLWRSAGPVLLTDPTASPPRSAMNTGDLYKAVIDAANPKWPSRAKSVVGSTDSTRAEEYGTTYIMVPRDDAVIGCTGTSDMWDSKVNVISEIAGIYTWVIRWNLRKPYMQAVEARGETPDLWDEFDVRAAALARDGERSNRTAKPLQEWKRLLNELRSLVDRITKYSGADEAFADSLQSFDDRARPGPTQSNRAHTIDLNEVHRVFVEWARAPASQYDLIDALIPICKYEALGMRLTTPFNPLPGEVWTESPCLLITPDALQALMTEWKAE